MTNPALRLSIVLLSGACVVFATVLGLQLASEKPSLDGALSAPSKTVRDETVSAPARFAMPPMATFVEIEERPLFSRSRRPPLTSEAVGESAGALVLNGVIVTGTGKIALLAAPAAERMTALLAAPAAERMTALREGDTLAGWTLVAIHPEKVVIRNNGMEHELQIADTLRRTDSPVRQRAQQLRAKQMRAELARQQAPRAQQQRVAERNAAEPAAGGSPASPAASSQAAPEQQQSQDEELENPDQGAEPDPPVSAQP